ncbi:hypothetical protein Droror1_Dr00018033 [Drosera rotundifolia]
MMAWDVLAVTYCIKQYEQYGKVANSVLVNTILMPVEKKDTAASQDQVFVRQVIELHNKFMAYVNDFVNHTLFHKALKEAFENFCNKGVVGSSSAKLLATFCDNILKKGGNEKLSDEAIEETLEKDRHFPYSEWVPGKKLARRLLFGQSASEDHERSILSKLKQLCGGQFSSKMKRMVTDMTMAKDNQSIFEEYLSSNPHIPNEPVFFLSSYSS